MLVDVKNGQSIHTVGISQASTFLRIFFSCSGVMRGIWSIVGKELGGSVNLLQIVAVKEALVVMLSRGDFGDAASGDVILRLSRGRRAFFQRGHLYGLTSKPI